MLGILYGLMSVAIAFSLACCVLLLIILIVLSNIVKKDFGDEE